MSKIKDVFSKIGENVKNNIKYYKGTYIAIFIVTIFFLIFVDSDIFEKYIYDKILIMGLVCSTTNFFIENITKDNKKRIIGYVISFIIGIIFNICLNFSENIIPKILAVYLVTVICLSIFNIIKNYKIKTHNYLLQVFQNLFYTGIIYLTLNIGLTIIVSIFSVLLWSSGILGILTRVQIALIGFFLMPGIIYAFTKKETELSKFIKGLVDFVLLPLVIITMIIIYIYMAKIIITWQIPSNAIYRILAGLFILALPIWTMAYDEERENEIVKRIVNILPITFIPFIFLQIYSISTRCISYGITPLRYISYIFLIFEIVSIFLSIYKKKEKLNYIFILIPIIIAVTLIGPLNYETVSNKSQAKILKENWQEGVNYDDLTKEQKEKAKSSYTYLKYADNAKKYIPDYIDKEKLEEDLDYKSVENEYKYMYYARDEKDDEWIDISRYSQIKQINISSYNNENSIKEYEKLLKDLVKKYNDNEKETINYLENNCIIQKNESENIYIKSINIKYKKIGNEFSIENYTIKGYLLK